MHSANGLNLQTIDQSVREATTAVMITDAKALYDSIARSESAGGGLKDRRSAIEVMALRQEMAKTGTELRWVHSEAMIADGLTKDQVSAGGRVASGTTLDFARQASWRIVHDPDFVSAKKRRARGIHDVLATPDDTRPPIVPELDADDDDDHNAAAPPLMMPT